MALICRYGVTGIIILKVKWMAFPVLYSYLFIERQRFDQFFGPHQDYKRKYKMSVYKINKKKKKEKIRK